MPSFCNLIKDQPYLEQHVRLALNCATSALNQLKDSPEDIRVKLSVDLCLTELVRLLRPMNIQDSMNKSRVGLVAREVKARKKHRLPQGKAEQLELEFEDDTEV